MFNDAVAYPFNAEDWLKPLLIGGILLLGSVFIVPAFLIQGYSIRVLRSAARGRNTPPAFTKWDDLALNGLKMTAIGVCYFIPYTISIVPLFVVRVGER